MMIPLVGMLGEVARILEGEDRHAMARTVREAGEAITRHHADRAELMRERDEAILATQGRKLEVLGEIPRGPAPGEPPPPPPPSARRPAHRARSGFIKRPLGVRIPPEALFGDAPISHSISRAEAEAAARAFYYDEVKGHPLIRDDSKWEDLPESERERRTRVFID